MNWDYRKDRLDSGRRTDEERALDREAFAFRDKWGGYRINSEEHMKRMGRQGRSVGVQRNTDGARPGAAGNLSVGVKVSGRDSGEQQNQRNAPQRHQAPPARSLELIPNHHRLL